MPYSPERKPGGVAPADGRDSRLLLSLGSAFLSLGLSFPSGGCRCWPRCSQRTLDCYSLASQASGKPTSACGINPPPRGSSHSVPSLPVLFFHFSLHSLWTGPCAVLPADLVQSVRGLFRGEWGWRGPVAGYPGCTKTVSLWVKERESDSVLVEGWGLWEHERPRQFPVL